MANWYKWYPGDFLRDTLELTLEEEGAYRRLLDHYMMTEQPIPNDIHKVRRILGNPSLQKTRKFFAIFSRFFEEKNGFFYHKKCENALDNILKKKESQRANAYARWHAKSMPPDTRYQIKDIKKENIKEKKPAKKNGTAIAVLSPSTLDDSISIDWEKKSQIQKAHHILFFLNERTGQKFKTVNPSGKATASADLVIKLSREGYVLEDFVAVINGRIAKWGTDEKMREYLRPSTLFRKSKFEDYLGENDEPANMQSPRHSTGRWQMS